MRPISELSPNGQLVLRHLAIAGPIIGGWDMDGPGPLSAADTHALLEGELAPYVTRYSVPGDSGRYYQAAWKLTPEAKAMLDNG